MNVTLDIAAVFSACFALLGALVWPLVILVILLAYHNEIPALIEGLASRVSKLEFAGVSIELAIATPFVPEWSEAPGALDLRHKATSIQVIDNTARTFLTQLTAEGTADYAEINLGTGREWLTSRLFIMAIVYSRMKGIECYVFIETARSTRKRYIGWAEPRKIHWALARRYPWLEQAYADAYSTLISIQNAAVVSNQGRLGYSYDPTNATPGIDLLTGFLQKAQASAVPPPLPGGPEDWILIDPKTNTYEHAGWISGDELEEILRDDLNTSTIQSSELRSKTTTKQLQKFLATPGRFVAVVADDKRLEYMVDRNVLLEQVAKRLSSDTDSRG